MQFAGIVDTWRVVRATRSRTAKVAALADALRDLASHSPDVLAAGTAMLTGSLRQGRFGVGWAALRDLNAPPADEPSLTVQDIDGAVDELAATTGAGSVARRRDQLIGLFSRATADEQEVLQGLILNNLRQGALEGVVTAAVAEAADVNLEVVRRAAMLTGDLTATAVMAMSEGEERLRTVRLQVGRAIAPMLASSAPDSAAALALTGPARVDTKLDGMRIQVHRHGDDVRVFTRSLRDVTTSLPAVAEFAARLPCNSVVLDGEALAVDGDGRPRAFQDSMSSDALQPYFFDLLHLDGTDLLDNPLSGRIEALGRLVGDRLVPGVVTDDPGEATDHLRAALAAGHEGTVVKALDSTWQAGRRGSDWVKVKVAHTLDLVVLAVEWGSGRRRGWLSNIHLGAIDPDTGEPVMLGKTFKGMTDEMLEWQTQRFLELETHRDDHVVHVRPVQVVEVALDGVQASPRYPAGMALRFARVKRYRDDKPAAEADTLDTVRAIHDGTLIPEV